MSVHSKTLQLATRGKGTYELTTEAEDFLRSTGLQEGLLTVFCKHTSCGLVLMENADPSARRDLEDWFERYVPENDPAFTHTLEGADDMPSHIRMVLTRSSESIPFTGGRLQLGTWQGLMLFEHRRSPHTRSLVISVIGE